MTSCFHILRANVIAKRVAVSFDYPGVSITRFNYGFSLIELLVAIFISTLLMSGAMEVLMSFKKTYRLYQEQQISDAELRLAMLDINRWIKLAGYQGCINQEERVNRKEAIMGFSARTLPKHFGIAAKEDSDVLLIRECEWYQGRWQFLKKAIYIGKTNRKTKDGKIIYALYDKKVPGKSEELSSQIQSLEIRYGVRKPLHSEVSHYERADQVFDWSSVVSVEYRLNHFANGYVALREFL